MIEDMRSLRVTVGLAAIGASGERREVIDVMVDTSVVYNWIPSTLLMDLGVSPVRMDRFEMADGRVLEREIGFALLYAAGRSTATIVVFAQEGDMVLLGAHGLEGMNLRVDLNRRELIPAGPVPVAIAA
jgi:predicted aspartyl protease